jgi:hypothetical protein
VKVHFTNGDASFEMKHMVSKERMTELIDSLNATSEALQRPPEDMTPKKVIASTADESFPWPITT